MAFKNFILIFVILLGIDKIYTGSSHKNIVGTRVNGSIKIDGLLNEDVWQMAVPSSNFVQREPIEGAPPTEQTSVRILYDDQAIYVGVICYDSEPEGIRQQLTRRDRSGEADRFSITIDSYNDGQTGFVFVGNVSGVQADGVMYQDGVFYDIQWDAVWNYAAQIIKEGWSAEFKIPYSALRFSKQEGEYIWGINFRRYISRKKEIIEWVLISSNETGSISKIGNLSGLVNINPSLNMNIQPYALTRANFEQEIRPYNFQKVVYNEVGIDLKYGLSNNFTLDAAINPDFGQVEVDQEVMNLTVFETHFPEKRPFFLEGGHIFTFGVTSADQKQFNLFYSRRIGRAPRLSLNVTNAEILNSPKTTTILGAAKITGRSSSRTTLGMLTTITDEERVLYKIDGEKKTALIEPRASYNVIRLKQELLDYSSIGLMTTAAFLKGYNPSVAGGIDWNFRLADYKYAIDGFYASSQYATGLDRQKYFGNTGKLSFAKIAGKSWLYNTYYEFSSKNFYIDELGYFSQPREHGGATQIIYKNDQAEKYFLRYGIFIQLDYRWNFNNLMTTKNYGFGSEFIFKNFWSVSLFLINQLPAFHSEERGIIDVYKTPRVHSLQTIIRSDTRKKISFGTHLIYEFDSKQKKEFLTSLYINYRPTTWIELSPIITFAKRWAEESGLLLGTQYWTEYDTLQSKYFTVFGDRDLNYFDMALRGIVTLSNKLSVQFFSQLMFYKWHYRNFKRLVNPDQMEIIDFGFYYRDFNYKIMNANIVIRWEFLPASTLFFVWTHMKEGIDNLYYTKLNNDIANTLRIFPNNVVLLKINYWFSL